MEEVPGDSFGENSLRQSTEKSMKDSRKDSREKSLMESLEYFLTETQQIFFIYLEKTLKETRKKVMKKSWEKSNVGFV